MTAGKRTLYRPMTVGRDAPPTDDRRERTLYRPMTAGIDVPPVPMTAGRDALPTDDRREPMTNDRRAVGRHLLRSGRSDVDLITPWSQCGTRPTVWTGESGGVISASGR